MTFVTGQVIEKIYLGTDKEIYEPSDTLWFKGYVFNQFNGLSDQSVALHITLIDEEGTTIRDTSWPIYDGVTHGQIPMPRQEGKYLLNAFSGKMIGAGAENVFTKEVFIRSEISDEINISASWEPSSENVLIIANLSDREPASDERFVYELWSKDERVSRGSFRTDGQGAASLNLSELKDANKAQSILIRSTDNDLTKEVKLNIPLNRQPSDIDLKFFPEGGNLVASIPNKIAFKAIDNQGDPFDFEGLLYNSERQVIDTIRSEYMGMGAFFLSPETTHYYVKIIKPFEFNKEFSLPEAMRSGTVMSIVNSPVNNEKLIRLTSTDDKVGNEVILRIDQYDETIVSYGTILKSRQFLPKVTDNLHPGIVKITLYDQDSVPLQERLVFVKEDEQLKLEISTNKEFYLPREQVDVTLKVLDHNGDPVMGNFSLAAIDDTRSKSPNPDQPHLMAQMLLNSELKGQIPTPNYYFSNSPDARKRLDLVMMTHGWRKYRTSIYKDPEGIFGTLADGRSSRKTIKGTSLSLISLNTFMTEEIPVDESGNFYVGSQFFKARGDSFLLSTEVRGKKEKPNLKISDTTRLNLINFKKKIGQSLLSDTPDFSIYLKKNKVSMDQFQNTMILNSVTVTARSFSENPCSLNDIHFEYPWKTMTADELDLSNLDIVSLSKQVSLNVRGYGEVLRERIIAPGIGRGANFFSSETTKYPMVFSFDALLSEDVRWQPGPRGGGGMVEARWYQTVPYFVMINCKPIRPANNTTPFGAANPVAYDMRHRSVLESIDFGNIESISVKAGGVSLTPMILINTVNGHLNCKPQLQSFYTFATYYDEPIEYYIPKYETEEEKNLPIPDLRTTIHWVSNVITNEEGQASVSFYNADRPNRIRITVEGINGDSQMGFAQKDYRVLSLGEKND